MASYSDPGTKVNTANTAAQFTFLRIADKQFWPSFEESPVDSLDDALALNKREECNSDRQLNRFSSEYIH